MAADTTDTPALIGGAAHTHPDSETQPILAAPTAADEFNTVQARLIPLACWRLNDIRFEFDSSIVLPDARAELKDLQNLRHVHAGASCSVFGHADPVGDDDYNKQLSGRRARAIYALLIRDLDTWDELYNTKLPRGGDNWRPKAIEVMRGALGLPDTGEPSKDERRKLFAQYMEFLCVDSAGKPFQLQRTDFLAQGADSKGKGDVQGCSEFNPLLMFSQAEKTKFDNPSLKEQRDAENQPNRRVVIFLFRPGAKVSPNRWPCPRATEGPAACTPRFWSDFKTRRQFQAKHREFEVTHDTFACRFYQRLATISPCERVSPVPPNVVIIHVCLRLSWMDPTQPPVSAVNHPFPPGFPVIVEFQDKGTQNEKVGTNGLLQFDTVAGRQAFTLRFEPGDGKYIVSAPKGASPQEQLLDEPAVDAQVKKESRVWKLPPKFSLKDTDWSLSSTPANFTNGVFTNLPGVGPTLGTPAAPIEMILDPHWQFLKFSYFDRKLKARLPILPVLMEGFETAKGTGKPLTRSNWATEKGCQALPWVVRTKKKPDGDTLLRFQTEDHTFVESTDSADTRKLVSGDARETPSADRLRFYDLPKLWKSTKYFCMSGPKGSPSTSADVYEKIASQPTSDDLPLVFSLDDMVLTDAKLTPVDWKPKDRAAIFGNTFHVIPGGPAKNLGPPQIGVFNPDDGNKQSYFSEVPKFAEDRNYISDYPDWTRLVAAQGNLFSAFEKRTVEGKGEVVGARAAVRLVNSPAKAVPGVDLHPRPDPEESPFFTVHAFYEQRMETAFDAVAAQDIGGGRLDLALLRCCDVDGEVEVAVVMQYERHNFNFSPPAEPGTKPLKAPLNKDKALQAEWGNDAIVNSIVRWNCAELFHMNRAVLFPQDAAAHKIRIDTAWFGQVLPSALSHMRWSIFEKGRAGTQDDIGRGGFEKGDNQAGAKNDLAVAHEFGHVGSLGDSYIEPALGASYFRPAIFSYSPGSPFFIDKKAMMNETIEPTHRYFWHLAEWLHKLKGVGFACEVRESKDPPVVYKLPSHSGFPKRSFVNVPLARAINTSVSGKGRCDLFLYPLGTEEYTQHILPQTVSAALNTPPDVFDGILSVVVKLKLRLNTKDHPTILSRLSRIYDAVDLAFQNNWFVTGDLTAPTATGNVKFDAAYLFFSLRVLVPDFSGDQSVKDAMGVKTAAEYAAKVVSLENTHGVHHFVSFVKKGKTGWTTKPAPPAKPPRGHLDILESDNLTTVFPPFFWEMLGLPDHSNDALSVGATALESLVHQVMPNAKVHPYP